MSDLPIALQIMHLRSEIGQLGYAINSLRQAGLDSATVQKLFVQKRVELECLMKTELSHSTEKKSSL